ncbi:MAG TPA: hypothetical protein DIT61_00575 [Pseudomonas sp.]|nr:hypothetical protein [Pseudomonas sp.]HCP01999.1 hypothetical protein [Pseudomonas sp.]
MLSILESRQGPPICYFSTGLVGLGDDAERGWRLTEKPAAFSILHGLGAGLVAAVGWRIA